MRTTEEVRKYINYLSFSHEHFEEIKEVSRKLMQLKTCLYYLESNPTRISVEKQLEHVSKIITTIEDESNYSSWKISNPNIVKRNPNSNDLKRTYNNEFRLTIHYEQKQMLEYILKIRETL